MSADRTDTAWPPPDVHPQIRVVLEKTAALKLRPIAELDPPAARAQLERVVALREVPTAPIQGTEDLRLETPGHAMAARLYRPAVSAAGPLPLLVYYHGGGHVIGSIATHEAVARNICGKAGCLVLSVDYRMGPEHRFPVAVADCDAALCWARANAAAIGADPDRIAVGGDSAGGNLATVVALLDRDRGGPKLRLQLLTYPVTDYRCQSPSYARYAVGYGQVERVTMHWFRDHYLNDGAEAEDWRASPLLAPDLAGSPPALVLTAECDVLRDEAVDYVARLRATGVAVEHLDYPGMIHGFFSLIGAVDAADAAHDSVAAALRRAFAA